MALEYNTVQYAQISMIWDAVNTNDLRCRKNDLSVLHCWYVRVKYTPLPPTTTTTITLGHYFYLPVRQHLKGKLYLYKRDHLLLLASNLTLHKVLWVCETHTLILEWHWMQTIKPLACVSHVVQLSEYSTVESTWSVYTCVVSFLK